LSILDGGSTVRLAGNSWVKYEYPYTVTPDTILSFDFKADSQAEIHGIGVDTDNDLNTQPDQFAVYGTQNAPKLDGFNIDFKTYASPGEWQHYEINLGDYFTGDAQYLTMVHDHDAVPQDDVSYFRNVALFEPGAGQSNTDPVADIDGIDFVEIA
jgi:hypothetical protein